LYNPFQKLALKKLSITLEQSEQVKELLADGLSTYKISEILNIPQAKVWRNAQLMGLNKKRQTTNTESQYFKWEQFGNCLI